MKIVKIQIRKQKKSIKICKILLKMIISKLCAKTMIKKWIIVILILVIIQSKQINQQAENLKIKN